MLRLYELSKSNIQKSNSCPQKLSYLPSLLIISHPQAFNYTKYYTVQYYYKQSVIYSMDTALLVRVITLPSKGIPGLYHSGVSSNVTVLMILVKVVCPLPLRMTPVFKDKQTHHRPSAQCRKHILRNPPPIYSPTCAKLLYCSTEI